MLIGGAIGGAEPAVAGAIRNAANATGTKFEYLLATAKVESGFNPNASARTSSARGLFQFLDRTWLATLKQAGPSLGYGKLSSAIVQNSDGQFSVPDTQARAKILALRSDPTANAAMAGAFTSQNAALLADKLGRPPTEGELYMAHFLGANGASKLIALAAEKPGASAAQAFPRAAQANRSIFYDAQGGARTAADVYASLAGRYGAARAGIAIAATQPLSTVQPVAKAAATTAVTPLSNVIAASAANGTVSAQAVRATPSGQRPVFHNLFNGGERSGPVSDVVRDLWTNRPHVAAALSGTAPPPPISRSTFAVQPVNGVTSVNPIERLQNLFSELLTSRHT